MSETKTRRRAWGIDTSWDELGWIQYPQGITSSRFVLGDPDDPDAPVVMRSFFPPGSRVEPHHHPCDYCEIILEGTQQVTGKWHKAGDVRISTGGRGYGPLIAGPEGVHVIVIFRNQNWQTEFGKKSGDGAEATPEG